MGNTAFVFRGHFEKHGTDTWAICDHAPVFASGDGEESALNNMEDALGAYLRLLSEHKELDAAISAGKLVKIELTRTGLPTRRLKRGDGEFEAILSLAA